MREESFPFQFLHGHILIRSDGHAEHPFLLEVNAEGVFCYPLDSSFESTLELPALPDHLKEWLFSNGSRIHTGGDEDNELRGIFLAVSRNGAPPSGGYEIISTSDPDFANITSAWDVRLFRGRTKLDGFELAFRLVENPWSIYLAAPHIVFGDSSPRKAEYARRYPRIPRNNREIPEFLFQTLPIYSVANIVSGIATTRYGKHIKPENLVEIDKISRYYLKLMAGEAHTLFRGARRFKTFAFSFLRKISQWKPLSRAMGKSLLGQPEIYERICEESVELGTNSFTSSVAMLKYVSGLSNQTQTRSTRPQGAAFERRVNLIANALKDEG
jgi:hypothetical protein